MKRKKRTCEKVDEKVVCQRDHERASHYTTLRNYDIRDGPLEK